MADVTNATARAQLEEERARIRGQLEQMGHFGDGSLSFDEGFADSGQVTAERGEVEALANSLVETLTEVEHALEKFDSGTYGVCEICGEPHSRGPPGGQAGRPAVHQLRFGAPVMGSGAPGTAAQ